MAAAASESSAASPAEASVLASRLDDLGTGQHYNPIPGLYEVPMPTTAVSLAAAAGGDAALKAKLPDMQVRLHSAAAV